MPSSNKLPWFRCGYAFLLFTHMTDDDGSCLNIKGSNSRKFYNLHSKFITVSTSNKGALNNRTGMSWKTSSSVAQARNVPKEKPLPPGFVSIRDILDGQVGLNRMTNVVGLVKDRRTIIQTRGTDCKSGLKIYDKSTEEDGADIDLSIFRPQHEMPEPAVGDIVVIFSAKVQEFRGEKSLITHHSTEIHTYTAKQIPRPPKSALQALQPPLRSRGKAPGEKEHEYVSWLHHATSKDWLPSTDEFQINVERSARVKEKFCLLKDVRDSSFVDLIVQTVKDPYEDSFDRTTMWVTDFTQNDAFYLHKWDGTHNSKGREGDPYGYITNEIKDSHNWPGPFGKRCMQITCFGDHGSYIREQAQAGTWIMLRNVQIKYGRNGNNLEGFLREDRGPKGVKLQVDILDTTDSENADDRLKQAIRRKREYEKNFKQQMKTHALNENGKNENGKRPAEEPAKENAKGRRRKQRAEKQKKVEQQEAQQKAQLGLNKHIKCESLDQPVVPLSQILEPKQYSANIEGQEVRFTLPFINIKYHANVRVVDFQPYKLENFATWRKNTEFDLLSDNGDQSESESDDEDVSSLDRYVGEKTWEWRFALQLEEVGEKLGKNEKPNRLWAVVDNYEAQQLLSLDASDLRANTEDLETLREQLFTLWGNLEEQKQKQHSKERMQQQQARERLEAGEPPPDSDNEESAITDQKPAGTIGELSNMPFTCCLKQFGIKEEEADPKKANAGDGKRWERMFALFGTKICS